MIFVTAKSFMIGGGDELYNFDPKTDLDFKNISANIIEITYKGTLNQNCYYRKKGKRKRDRRVVHREAKDNPRGYWYWYNVYQDKKQRNSRWDECIYITIHNVNKGVDKFIFQSWSKCNKESIGIAKMSKKALLWPF